MDPKTEFELDYWRKVRTGHDRRYAAILEHWGVGGAESILEIGTGPLGGVLPFLNGRRLVGIDPLYAQYEAERLLWSYSHIEYVTATAETYKPTEQFDLIVSMNALDHGECDFDALDRIATWLKPGGTFCLHVHLRRPDQLNVGHDHPLSEEQLAAALARNGLATIKQELFGVDPIEKCAYKTVIGMYRR